MIHFPSELKISPMRGENWEYRRLLADYTYRMSPDARRIIVPAGFSTDYASIPRIFRPWIPTWGRYGPAAIVHDYLYDRGGQIKIPDPKASTQSVRNTRKRADKIFLIAMQQLNVGWIKRHVMYRAVRLFGSSAYESKNK